MTVKPGNPATPADLARAELTRQLRTTELERVRKAAEGWRTGLAALFALVTTVSIVKGKDVITDLPDVAQSAVGAFVLLSLVCAVWGGVLAMRAAYGLPTVRSAQDALESWYQEPERAAENLGHAIWLTVFSVAFLAGAVAVTWYGGTEAAPSVQIATDHTQLCGRVKKIDGSTMTITIGSAERDIPVADVRGISAVGKCD